MSKISFEGIGEVVATFLCEEGVEAGQVVQVKESGKVGTCAGDDGFCGVALSVEDGYAAVQIGGLVKVAASEDVTAGWCRLLANGTGGVKKDSATSPNGRDFLVVSKETDGAVVRL